MRAMHAGGMCLRGSSPFAASVGTSTFVGNWVNSSSSYAFGGGLWTDGMRSVILSNSTFLSNSVAMRRSDGALCAGAAAAIEGTRTTIRSSTFTLQRAWSASSSATSALGAVYISSPGVVSIEGSTISRNSAAYSGVRTTSLLICHRQPLC